MKHIERRISSLEARQPPKGRSRELLGKLTDEELDRLEKACIRTQDWKLPLTTEETVFIKGLEARYGITDVTKWIENLERKSEPLEVIIAWADDDEPVSPDTQHIHLRWFDELEKEH
jgi:hypothetical protein